MTASPAGAPSAGRLSGQVAVVTGGASGIGEAIVRRVVDDGGKVVVGDRDERRLALLQKELGDRIFSQPCDVRVESDVAGLVSPKLRALADANACSDLGKRWVRPVGVLTTCHCPAQHPAVR
jgi:NAD(P)-dependent dehydrogenase (short-subunit alcohol dehydrogenase family)